MPLLCQQLFINNQGERIVIFPDGSWRLALPADSIFTSNPEGDDPKEGETGMLTASNWSILRNRVLAEEKIARESFRVATNEQFKASDALRNAKKNSRLLGSEQIAGFEMAYAASVDHLASARKRRDAIEKVARQARQTELDNPDPTGKQFARLEQAFNKYLQAFDLDTPPVMTTGNRLESRGKPNPELSNSATAENPPSIPPCNLTRRSADSRTGISTVETAPSLLFFYTDPELRSFFKNKDLITCRSRMSRTGSSTFLELEFEIASANSRASFGGIAQGALLRLKLIDGTLLTFYNMQNDPGHVDTYTGHTVFSAQYAVGREEVRKLQTGELDKIRVLWITGFEDYEIIFPDAIRHQLRCLATD